MKYLVALLVLASIHWPLQAQEPCPVQITQLNSGSNVTAGLIAAMVDPNPSHTFLTLKYRNYSSQIVSGVRFQVGYLSSVMDIAHSETMTTTTVKLKPGKSGTIVTPDEWVTGSHSMKTMGWVERVAFADGTVWSDDGSKRCSFTPSQQIANVDRQIAAQPDSEEVAQQMKANSKDIHTSEAGVAAEAKAGPLTHQQLMDLVKRKQGTIVSIVTTPPGAIVEVDGKVGGVTPLAFVLLKHEKPRVIAIKADGYATVEQRIDPHGGSLPLTLMLEKQF